MNTGNTSSTTKTTKSSTTNVMDKEEILLEETTAPYYKSYNDLLQLVQQLRFVGATDTTDDITSYQHHQLDQDIHRHNQLPNEICIRIAQYLTIQRVQMKDVIAIGCSSIQIPRSIEPNVSNIDANRESRSSNSNCINQIRLLSNCLTDDESTWWISTEGVDERYQFVDFCCIPPIHNNQNKDECDKKEENIEENNDGDVQPASSSSSLSLSSLSSKVSRVRIQSISIKIPPLPYGPMSLHSFAVQRSDQYYYPIDHIHRIIKQNNNDIDSDNNNNNNHINSICISPSIDKEIVWYPISPIYILNSHTSEYQTFTFDSDIDIKYLRIVCLSNQIYAINNNDESDDESDIPRNYPKSVGFYSIRFQ